MQKRFADTNPNCAVRMPIRQMMTLFTPAITHPCHNFLPTSTVEKIVKIQEM